MDEFSVMILWCMAWSSSFHRDPADKSLEPILSYLVLSYCVSANSSTIGLLTYPHRCCAPVTKVGHFNSSACRLLPFHDITDQRHSRPYTTHDQPPLALIPTDR